MKRQARKNASSPIPRIAYIIPLLHKGSGWGTFARGAIHSLAKYVEPVLVVARAEEAEARESFPGMELHTLPVIQPRADGNLWPLGRMAPAFFALRRMPRLGVDLVHSLEMFPTGWVGDSIARAEGAPHALTPNGTYCVVWKRWPVMEFFYRRVLRGAAGIFPISRGTETKLRALFGESLGAARVHPVIIGTDTAARVNRAISLGRTWPDSPRVLSVGGVKPRKGHHISLQAFGLLQRRYPDARYQIVGRFPEGQYRQRLEGIVREQGLRNVEFLGVVDSATWERAYREASLFILLSMEEEYHFEGFGLVYLEAGAFGLPVVGSRSGGIPDAVRDGETGFLVEPGNAEAAEAMIRLASDRKLSARMGRAGRAFAEELTWTRYAEEQWGEYRMLLGMEGSSKKG